MRFIEIDGKRYDVPDCGSCLFYDGVDGDYYGDSCTHPDGDGVCARWGGSCENGHRNSYGPNCPLRTKLEQAEGGVVDSPESNEEREIVIPEWAHIRFSEKEALGCLIAFCMPRLMEDIAKLDPKEQAQIVNNLEEMRRIARMKPEDVDLAESFRYIMDSRCYTVAKESKGRERVIIGEFGPGEREVVFPESFLGGPEVVEKIREALSSYGMVGVFIVSPQLAERHRD